MPAYSWFTLSKWLKGLGTTTAMSPIWNEAATRRKCVCIADVRKRLGIYVSTLSRVCRHRFTTSKDIYSLNSSPENGCEHNRRPQSRPESHVRRGYYAEGYNALQRYLVNVSKCGDRIWGFLITPKPKTSKYCRQQTSKSTHADSISVDCIWSTQSRYAWKPLMQ